MANAAVKIRAILRDHVGEITLAQIAEKTALKSNEISMVMCYLLKQRYVTRVRIKSDEIKGRKEVWSYTYHRVRMSVPAVKAGAIEGFVNAG
jgi:transcription initiation factor IIE alpha subunit